VNAVHGTRIDAGGVFGPDTRFSDYISHGKSSLGFRVV
jgi:hypothetical protein